MICYTCWAEGERSEATHEVAAAMGMEDGELYHFTGFLGPCCEKHYESRKDAWLTK